MIAERNADNEDIVDDDLIDEEDSLPEQDSNNSSDDDNPIVDDHDTGKLIVSGNDRAAVKGDDYIISYEIKDYINPKTGKPYSALRLKRKHPQIIFKQHHSGDDDGDLDETIVMVVNHQLAKTFGDTFSAIDKSYNGLSIEKKEKKTWKSMIDAVKEYWEYQPLKFIGLIVSAIIVIGLFVYGMIIS
jgi:hypothetical protein